MVFPWQSSEPVAAPVGRVVERRRRLAGTAAAFAGSAALLLAACAGAAVAPAGEPVPDPTGTAAALTSGSVPTSPRQINFDWTLVESGSRVSGRGVVRLQPPDRLRLDLFGPRNETYLSAALVGSDARLPAGAPDDVPIPSPALLWAGLGVIHPPRGATLEGVSTSGDATILRYREGAGGDLYEYTVSNGTPRRLRQLQRIGPRGPVETVGLEWSDAGEIVRATYRDWSAFRDLTLDIVSSAEAEPFPENIWTP